jgi:DNA repair and recombination protein RAD52
VDEIDKTGRHVIGYVATVKVSLATGASHEDCGTGECSDASKLKAIDTAFKAAVTDAMKRAARHFGERLGNGTFKE